MVVSSNLTQRLWTESPQVVSERLKIVSAKKLTTLTKTSDNIYISVILSVAEGSCQTISYLTSVRSFGCAQDDKIISLKSCTKSAQFLLADWDNKKFLFSVFAGLIVVSLRKIHVMVGCAMRTKMPSTKHLTYWLGLTCNNINC